MKLFYDILPIIVFFIIYKVYGIYAATASAICVSLGQVGLNIIKGKKTEWMQLTTLGMIVILGGATLLFRNEMFIKWKPTGVYWLLALVFLVSQLVSKKSIVERMLESNISLEKNMWGKLNFSWFTFFFIMGCLNIFVVYNFDTNTWVNFKLFGSLGLTLAFVLVQSLFLSKYFAQRNDNKIKAKNK